MKIAVIMIHYGSIATTKQCLALLAKKIEDHHLILINNTTDDISNLAKIIKNTKLINNSANLGFAKAVNQGILLAQKDKSVTHYFLMNNDLSISFGSFAQLLLTYTKHPTCGIVSPVLHHSNSYDWGGKYNKWTGMVKHKNWENKPKTIQTVDHVAGAAMLISKAVVDKIGMLDPRFFLYFEDLDYCLCAKQAGYSIHINPDIVAEHAVSASSNLFSRTRYQWASHIKFVSKHLLKLVYPTAYLYDIFIYPLWILGCLFKGLTLKGEPIPQTQRREGQTL